MVVAKKHHELYEALGSIVGVKYVADDLPVLLSYTRDMSPFPPAKPQGVVVLPGSVEEVVELVRLANQTLTPLIPIGGKAALAGNPPGQPGRGIIVDMRRMNKVIEIDEVNMAVTAQAGITMGELAGKVHERGWDITTAEMPHYSVTVGGQLSGFAGGGWGSYGYSVGFMNHYLLGIKVVLPDGNVVDTGTGEGSLNTYRGNTFARAMHGPDLAGMFISDGGIFGIKVEATYRMFRPPKFQKRGVQCWDNLDDAYQALYELSEIDPYLYVQPFAKLVLVSPEIGYLFDPDAEQVWYLIWWCIGNSEEEIELKARTTKAVLARHGGREPVLAPIVSEFISELKNMRKFATLGQMPWFEFIDSRRDNLGNLKWTREYVFNSMRERGVDLAKLTILNGLTTAGLGCGIATTGVFYDQQDKEVEKAVHEAMAEFFEQGRRRGYVIEAGHGHESRLRAKSWTPEFYNYALTLKKTLDPNNIMNPGVYFR